MLSKTDINSAVKNLKNLSYLPELQEATVIESDKKGFLFCLSGGFNLVYKYLTVQKQTKALRINFTGNFDAVFLRIAKIADYLKHKDLPYFVDFTYYEKALFIKGQDWSAITMEWREGLLLKDYLKAHLQQPQKIAALAEAFKTMIETLHKHQIAHGDLQHGNILVHPNGNISLLDYDSVIIPEFVDSQETITGLRTYQHPQRFLKTNNNSHLKIDFFSELVIYASLVVLSKQPELFNSMALDKTEGLLFTEADFKDIGKAAVTKDIVAIAGCEPYMIILAYYLSLENLHDLVYFGDLLSWLEAAKGRERFYGFYGNYYHEKMQAAPEQATIFKTEAEKLNWWQKQKLLREGKNKLLSEPIENKPEARKSLETFKVNGYSFDMIFVEGGSFMMGATAEQGNDARDNEKPVHEVRLDSFYLGKFVVKQGLWVAVMGNNPSHFKLGNNHPVESVSWNDCQEFISKLNSLTGKNFRLPTEAEWEYAARGGPFPSSGYC